VVQALKVYANKHGDFWPVDIDAAVAAGAVEAKRLVCLSGRMPYVFVRASEANANTGANQILRSTVVIMYEPIENHGEGGNFIYLDSRVEFLRRASYVLELARLTRPHE